MLLYVAPTVIGLGLIPGLPIVLDSGPSLPAATTTTMPSCIALFTVSSILELVLFTPKLILIISTSSMIACSIALTIKSDDTESPSLETL